MKKGLFFAAICFATISLSSCGPSWNGKSVSTSPADLTNFSRVNIDAYVDATIHVQPGAGYSVKFEGEEDALKDLETTVEDGELIIDRKDGFFLNFGSEREIKVQITVPSLAGISFAGAGQIVTTGIITGSNFDLDVSGAGGVKIAEVNVDKLNVASSGAAEVEVIKGVVREADYSFSGVGSMDAYGVQCTDAVASISGVGGIEVSVSGKLDASLSGVGSILYKGHPHVESDVSGVGQIKDAN